MSKPIILSASVPSGVLTLGNYIGAIKNWSEMQENYECFFPVADLHSITTKQDPKILRERSLSFYVQYLALGLDAEKHCVFMQSHVSAHAELAWVLNCFAPMGALNRMTQFKDKSQKNVKNINAGLFGYPVLMAADILLYQANCVPIGDDQKQHLELTRDIAQTFNNQYGETFTIPEPYIAKTGARIMALNDPNKKMSKSDENPNSYISILDEPKKIMKKVKSAVTDSGTVVKYDSNNEEKKGIANLMTIYSVFSGKTMPEIETEFEGKMYGHLKIATGELICSSLEPVQKKYQELMNNRDYIDQLLKKNTEIAQDKANATLKDVYEKVGFFR